MVLPPLVVVVFARPSNGLVMGSREGAPHVNPYQRNSRRRARPGHDLRDHVRILGGDGPARRGGPDQGVGIEVACQRIADHAVDNPVAE